MHIYIIKSRETHVKSYWIRIIHHPMKSKGIPMPCLVPDKVCTVAAQGYVASALIIPRFQSWRLIDIAKTRGKTQNMECSWRVLW